MPTHLFCPLTPPLDNAVAITALFSTAANTSVYLVRGALYPLYSTIRLTSSSSLSTQGDPTFTSGHQAILETRGEDESCAVEIEQGSTSCSLRSVHIRGCRGWGRTPPSEDEKDRLHREEEAMGWLENGRALVLVGASSVECIVQSCRLEDPRGWSALHVIDYAERTSVIDNIVGPCGQEAPGGPWADGLSIAGRDSIVVGNTIVDATDGAIVIFCAPGSLISNNHIISRSRDLLGAINLVDDFPYAGDYSNVKVIANTIATENDAFIHLGIGIGPSTWSPALPSHTLNYGALIAHNALGPGNIGYGIALSSARSMVVHSNRVIEGTALRGDNSIVPQNASPMPFLVDRARVKDVEVGSEFIDADGSNLIGLRRGWSKSIAFREGQITLENKVELQQVIIGIEGNEIIVRERDDQRGVVWRSGEGAGDAEWESTAKLVFEQDRFELISTLDGTTLWSPIANLSMSCTASSSILDPTRTWSDSPTLIVNSHQPYLNLYSGTENLLWSTEYIFQRDDFTLKGNSWIALESGRTFLYLDGQKGRLVLHSSSTAIPSSTSRIHWIVPPSPAGSLSLANLSVDEDDDDDKRQSNVVFQGDGNIVLYTTSSTESIQGIWATGTNGERRGETLRLFSEDDEGGARFVVLDEGGEEVFSSR